jgi:hypothetical protein
LRLALMLVFAFALTAPALAVSSPAPSDSPHAVATKTPADFWDVAAQRGKAQEAALYQYRAALSQLTDRFQTFGESVYAPYCAKLCGLAGVKLTKTNPLSAWPATVICKSGQHVTANGPTP